MSTPTVQERLSLAGRVAVVTGGGRGFGEQSARELARLGAAVGIVEIDGPLGASAAASLESEGLHCASAVADVADPDAVIAAFAQLSSTLGPVDILVNNAGIVSTTPFLELSEAEWDATLSVNLTGAYLCSKAVVPSMTDRGFGRVINIASVAGKRGGGFLGRSAYAAAKAGVIGLTKALARELAPDGITVNAIAPGPMDTEMTKVLNADPELLARVLEQIPLGRRGVIQDVADAVCFLSTDLASYFTGETLNIDGGVSME